MKLGRSGSGVRTTWVPPPVVTLVCAWAMWHLAGAPPWAQWAQWPSPWQAPHVTAIGLWTLALAIMALALATMRAQRTTPNPVRPEQASALVQTGVFAKSRNPIYLADAITLVGWAAWLSSAWALCVLPVFVAYITLMQIRAEEQALSALFGAHYSAYCQRVRRWL